MEERKPELLTKKQLREQKLKQTIAPVKRTLEITAKGAQALGKTAWRGLEWLGGAQQHKKRKIRVVKPEKPSLEVRIARAKARRERRKRLYY